MLGAVVISQKSLEPIVKNVAARYGLDPNLLKAHIKVESNWDVNASRYEIHKGDASWGLMQLMLATAREVLGKPNLTTTELINPEINIEAGAKYLAQQLARYYGDINSAIAAYNAGTARIKKGTNEFVNQSYVDKVNNAYNQYKLVGVAISTDDFIPTFSNPAPLLMYAGIGAIAFFMLKKD